jgi:LacI family transcriptional regulator
MGYGAPTGSRNEADVSTFRRATLADVARLAGVSGTTVSYILNGRAEEMRISERTTRRVLDAVAELGYRPNRSARSLRTRTTKTIGVLSDFVASGMFASRMLAGANAAARALDHVLVIGETEGDPAVEAVLLDEMAERQVDGLLYITRTTVETSAPAFPGNRVVMLNCTDPTRDQPCVLPDEEAGGRTAADTFLDAGIAEGIHIVGEDPTPHAIAGPLRLAGVRERLTAAGHDVESVIRCDWAVETAYEALHDFLRAGHRPRGLVCLNDRIAMGVYQALAEVRLRVPDDVAVVSFDGSELAGWLRPKVTSVALPFEEMGDLAVRLLLDPATHAAAPPRGPSQPRTASRRLVPMPLVPGESVVRRRPVRESAQPLV